MLHSRCSLQLLTCECVCAPQGEGERQRGVGGGGGVWRRWGWGGELPTDRKSEQFQVRFPSLHCPFLLLLVYIAKEVLHTFLCFMSKLWQCLGFQPYNRRRIEWLTNKTTILLTKPLQIYRPVATWGRSKTCAHARGVIWTWTISNSHAGRNSCDVATRLSGQEVRLQLAMLLGRPSCVVDKGPELSSRPLCRPLCGALFFFLIRLGIPCSKFGRWWGSLMGGESGIGAGGKYKILFPRIVVLFRKRYQVSEGALTPGTPCKCWSTRTNFSMQKLVLHERRP